MQPVQWQGQEYFTSQYFHAHYLANSPYGGKYRQHSNFLRVIRAIPAYAIYVNHADIVELDWSRIKAEANQILIYLKPLFEAAGHHPLTLLNATAQLALIHHLDDELSQQNSVVTNTNAARQLTRKPGALLPEEAAQRKLNAWLQMGLMLKAPEHIVQQEAAKQIEHDTGINLRPLLSAAPAQDNIKPEEKMLEPSDLSTALGLKSGAMVNKGLEHIGWQVQNISKEWEATPTGEPHSMRHAWIKGPKSGYNLKWNIQSVTDAFKAHGIISADAI